MKIIRIAPEIHSAFKDLCSREKIKLSDGADTLIRSALKRGTVTEVKQSVFTQIQTFENTFKSWMKTQEKQHLNVISEDLLSLSRRLKDVGTKAEINEVMNHAVSRIDETNKKSLGQYEKLHHAYLERKRLLLVYLQYFVIGLTSFLIVYLLLNLYLNYQIKNQTEQLEKVKQKYEWLHSYCIRIEENKKIKFVDNFDEWLKEEEKGNHKK